MDAGQAELDDMIRPYLGTDERKPQRVDAAPHGQPSGTPAGPWDGRDVEARSTG